MGTIGFTQDQPIPWPADTAEKQRSANTAAGAPADALPRYRDASLWQRELSANAEIRTRKKRPTRRWALRCKPTLSNLRHLAGTLTAMKRFWPWCDTSSSTVLPGFTLAVSRRNSATLLTG